MPASLRGFRWTQFHFLVTTPYAVGSVVYPLGSTAAEAEPIQRLRAGQVSVHMIEIRETCQAVSMRRMIMPHERYPAIVPLLAGREIPSPTVSVARYQNHHGTWGALCGSDFI
jgi:hypothetical protein